MEANEFTPILALICAIAIFAVAYELGREDARKHKERQDNDRPE